MKLPKTIKIGTTLYPIHQPTRLTKTAARGYIMYCNHIAVASTCNVTNKRLSPKQRAETFWHEVTHGILADMENVLMHDEKFVTAFSQRLNDAIHSAKF